MQVTSLRSHAPVATRADRDRLSVEIVDDHDTFRHLETAWNDAVDRAGLAHPFLCHEWIRTWWEAFGADRRLHIVVVRSHGRIIAIAPLMRETARMYGMPVRRLRLLQNDHAPRADFIVAEQAEEAYRAIWQALFDRQYEWDVLQLSQLPEESQTLEVVSELAAADDCATGVWASGSSPYLTLKGTPDEFFQHLTQKFRQNLRNRTTRLQRLGDPRLEVVSGGSEVWCAVEDAVRLEESGWKRRAGTAICCDEAIRRFYTLLAGRMSARGSLRLQFLNLNGRRIATSYSLLQEHRLFLCKTGYDPEFETCSPFKVLTSLLIRDAFEQGLEEVDFLGDPEPWKLEWTPTVRSHKWLFVFSETSRAKLLYPVKFQLVPALRRSGLTQLVGR